MSIWVWCKIMEILKPNSCVYIFCVQVQMYMCRHICVYMSNCMAYTWHCRICHVYVKQWQIIKVYNLRFQAKSRICETCRHSRHHQLAWAFFKGPQSGECQTNVNKGPMKKWVSLAPHVALSGVVIFWSRVFFEFPPKSKTFGEYSGQHDVNQKIGTTCHEIIFRRNSGAISKVAAFSSSALLAQLAIFW